MWKSECGITHKVNLCTARERPRLHCAHGVNFEHGAGAPSPPSEEGGGTAYKGLKRRDGRRDTPSMCESGRYRREPIYNDTCITLCTPTPTAPAQLRVLSPSVVPLNPLGTPAPSSEGAEDAHHCLCALFRIPISAFRISSPPFSLTTY